jgi:chromosome segregation ATPase
MKEQELFELKEEIEESKQELAELKGEKQALMKRLIEEWNCKTTKMARKTLDEMKTELETITSNINNGLEELELMLEQNGN